MTRSERIAELERSRPKLIEYMLMKADGEDWHGVQDAAGDLRDLDNELAGLTFERERCPLLLPGGTRRCTEEANHAGRHYFDIEETRG